MEQKLNLRIFFDTFVLFACGNILVSYTRGCKFEWSFFWKKIVIEFIEEEENFQDISP